MKKLSEHTVMPEWGNPYYVLDKNDDPGHEHDLETFLHCDILGFCGCGDPSATLKLLHDVLCLKTLYKKGAIDYKKYEESYKFLIKENTDKVQWLIDYFLDGKRITEHGGSVGGGWICDDNFFEALREWHKQYKAENPDGRVTR